MSPKTSTTYLTHHDLLFPFPTASSYTTVPPSLLPVLRVASSPPVTPTTYNPHCSLLPLYTPFLILLLLGKLCPLFLAFIFFSGIVLLHFGDIFVELSFFFLGCLVYVILWLVLSCCFIIFIYCMSTDGLSISLYLSIYLSISISLSIHLFFISLCSISPNVLSPYFIQTTATFRSSFLFIIIPFPRPPWPEPLPPIPTAAPRIELQRGKDLSEVGRPSSEVPPTGRKLALPLRIKSLQSFFPLDNTGLMIDQVGVSGGSVEKG